VSDDDRQRLEELSADIRRRFHPYWSRTRGTSLRVAMPRCRGGSSSAARWTGTRMRTRCATSSTRFFRASVPKFRACRSRSSDAIPARGP
jgi:hypothetical protein